MSILKRTRRGGRVRKLVDPGSVTVKGRMRVFGLHGVEPDKRLLRAIEREWVGMGNSPSSSSVYPTSFAPVIDKLIYEICK